MMLLLNQMMMDTMSMPNTGIQIPMTAFQTGQLEIESYPLNQLKRQVKAFLDYIA